VLVMCLNIAFPLLALYLLKNTITPFNRKFYAPLVEDYKTKHPIKKYFIVIVLTKRLLMSWAIVFFYHVPSLQNLVPWVLNILSICLFLYLKPHKRNAFNIINLVMDCSFLGIHSVIMLYCWDEAEIFSLSKDTKINIGYIIISLCLISIVIKLVILIQEEIRLIWKFIQKKRGKIEKKRPGINLRTLRLNPVNTESKNRPSKHLISRPNLTIHDSRNKEVQILPHFVRKGVNPLN